MPLIQNVRARIESDSLRDRFITGTVGTLALKVVFSGLTLALNVFLARVLGAAGYGAYTYSFAWATLLGIPAILGMDQLSVREMGALRVRAAWDEMRGFLRQTNRAVFLASTCIAGAAGAATWIFPGYFDPVWRDAFRVALFGVPIVALTRVRQAALQGLQYVASSGLPEFLFQPLSAILVTIAVWWLAGGLTAGRAMTIRIGTIAAAFLVGAWMLHRLLPEPVRDATPIYRAIAWKSSVLPLVFLASINVVYAQSDVIVLGALKGARAAGNFAVADRSAELINFLMTAVGSSFAPAIVRLSAADDRDRLQAAVTKVVRIVFLLAAPVALVLMFFGYWWLLYLYGPAYVEARRALAIISVGNLTSAGVGPVGLLLIMTGHERVAARTIAVTAALNVILSFALIPGWGVEGAAAASALSTIAWSVLLVAAVRRKLHIYPTIFGALRPIASA